MKTVLNTRRATVVCFLMAYINKLIIAWRFTDLEGDKALYFLISKSTLNGHFLLEPVQIWGMHHTSYIFNPASFSPVYPLLAAPFLWLTKSNYATSFIMDAISLAIFFAGLYRVSYYLFKQKWVSNLFLLFTGFFLYQHQLDSSPKDMLAVGLILLALTSTYRLTKSTDLRPALALVCFGLYAAIALTKFLYSPLVLLFLFFLVLNAVIVKTKTSVFHSVFVFLCCVTAFIAAYYFFLNFLPRTAAQTRIVSATPEFVKGFYPENLLKTFPFVSSSVMNTNFIGVQLEKTLHLPFSTVMQMFQAFDLFLAGMILWLLLRFRNRLIKRPLILMLIATAVVIIFMVAYMSLTNKSFIGSFSNNLYTYVQEYRSFLIPMIVVQLFLFYGIFLSTQLSKKIRILLLLLLTLECAHGIYFTVKQIAGADDAIAHVNSANKNLMRSIPAKKHGGQSITILTTNDLLRTLAMSEGREVYSFPSPCKNLITPVKPTVVVTSKDDSALVRDCLSKAGLFDIVSADNYELRYFHVR